MITIPFIIYNILRINKTIPCWLNLEYQEGLNTGLIGKI